MRFKKKKKEFNFNSLSKSRPLLQSAAATTAESEIIALKLLTAGHAILSLFSLAAAADCGREMTNAKNLILSQGRNHASWQNLLFHVLRRAWARTRAGELKWNWTCWQLGIYFESFEFCLWNSWFFTLVSARPARCFCIAAKLDLSEGTGKSFLKINFDERANFYRNMIACVERSGSTAEKRIFFYWLLFNFE